MSTCLPNEDMSECVGLSQEVIGSEFLSSHDCEITVDSFHLQPEDMSGISGQENSPDLMIKPHFDARVEKVNMLTSLWKINLQIMTNITLTHTEVPVGVQKCSQHQFSLYICGPGSSSDKRLCAIIS